MSRLVRHGLLAALLLMVCGAAPAPSAATVKAATATADKPLVVARGNPPFVIRDDAGRYHGIAIGLWNGVAKALGRTTVCKQTDNVDMLLDGVRPASTTSASVR